MSGIYLKVTPETLERKARSVEGSLGIIRRELNEITGAVASSGHYWEGNASQIHRQRYSQAKEAIDQVMNILDRQPEKLLRMAGIYKGAEAQAVHTADRLSDELIH